MPVPVPGMPGAPGGPPGIPPDDPGLGGPGIPPPGQEGDAEGEPSGGPEDEADAGGDGGGEGDDGGNPFAKNSYRTAAGDLLPEDAYLRHLAIALAPDPAAMARRIRLERGSR